MVGIDPGPHTLRKLVWMADGRRLLYGMDRLTDRHAEEMTLAQIVDML